MMKGLFRLLLFIIAAVLIYNYFFGDIKERQTSEQIVEQVKELGQSIGEMLVSEKDKIQSGKYDDALDKIGDFIKNMRSNSDELDVAALHKLNELEKQKNQLQEHIKAVEQDSTADEEDERRLKKEWEDLLNEMEIFIEDNRKR